MKLSLARANAYDKGFVPVPDICEGARHISRGAEGWIRNEPERVFIHCT